MFDSFYFLHIPKTGGRYFHKAVYDNLKPLFAENKIEIIAEKNHHCWSKDIKDDTYIFTIFRDPIKRLVSHYCHVLDLLTLNKVRHSFNYTSDHFILWVEKSEDTISNFQSKNLLCNHSETREDGSFRLHNNKDLNFKIDKNLLLERFNRINLKVKTENIDLEQSAIINKILLDFNIKYSAVPSPSDRFSLENSQQLYNELEDHQKEYLASIMELDYELYNSIGNI